MKVLSVTRLGIKDIDLFGQKVFLNIGKKDMYTTVIGGYASIGIITILVLFFWSNFISFFQKTSVTTFEKESFDSNPSQIELNEDNFMVAFSIQQLDSNYPFNTRPYFNITITQKQAIIISSNYTRLTNGTQLRQKTFLNLIPCTLDRFQNIFMKYGINFTEQYKLLNFDTWLCPEYLIPLISRNFSYKNKGVFASQEFLFQNIIVTNCSNSTAKNSFLTWKPVCAPYEPANSELKSNGNFKVQIYMINYILNSNKPSEYLQPYLDDSLYFTFVPYQLSRQANIFWRSNTLLNDQSLLPYEDIATEVFNIRGQSDYRDLTEIGRATDSTFAQFYFRRSNFSLTINRNYLKLSTLLSYLGGFVEIMMVIFGILVHLYNKQSYLINLSNQLYEFEQEQQNEDLANQSRVLKSNPQLESLTSRKSEKVELPYVISVDRNNLNSDRNNINSANQSYDFQSRQALQTPRQDALLVDHQEEIKKLGVKNRRDYLKLQIEKLLSTGKSLSFSLRFILSRILCSKVCKTKENTLLEKALVQINTDIDLIHILRKLQELEKLKQVLLNNKQLVIFNFIPKPQINLKQQKQIVSRDNLQNAIRISQKSFKSKSQELDENSILDQQQYHYQKLFKAYEQLQGDSVDTVNQKINQNLISKMGTELQSIFEISLKLKYDEKKQTMLQQQKSRHHDGDSENLGDNEIAEIKDK